MMDGLPKSVRVGPHSIRFESLTPADAKGEYGSFVMSKQTIYLDRDFATGSMAADTVIHEVLHAIFSVGSVEAKRGEEHIVSILATYLAQIIRDNPELIDWLKQTVNK